MANISRLFYKICACSVRTTLGLTKGFESVEMHIAKRSKALTSQILLRIISIYLYFSISKTLFKKHGERTTRPFNTNLSV